VLRATANYYALTGKNGKAEQYYLQSIAHTAKINRRYEIAKGYYEYGRFLKSLGKHNEAVNNWEKAYSIFSEIGAKAYIKKCKELLGLNQSKEEQPNEMTARERLKLERRISTVLDTGRYISSILDLDELLEKIMDSVMKLVGAERGIMLLYPEEGPRKLEIKVVRNVAEEEVPGREQFPSLSIIARVESKKKPLVIFDALSDEQYKNKASVILTQMKSVMCAPIMAKGEMKGIIYLDNSLLSGLFNNLIK
jgi:tetratricopeptide (TPR) repeat protein